MAASLDSVQDAIAELMKDDPKYKVPEAVFLALLRKYKLTIDQLKQAKSIYVWYTNITNS